MLQTPTHIKKTRRTQLSTTHATYPETTQIETGLRHKQIHAPANRIIGARCSLCSPFVYYKSIDSHSLDVFTVNGSGLQYQRGNNKGISRARARSPGLMIHEIMTSKTLEYYESEWQILDCKDWSILSSSLNVECWMCVYCLSNCWRCICLCRAYLT